MMPRKWKEFLAKRSHEESAGMTLLDLTQAKEDVQARAAEGAIAPIMYQLTGGDGEDPRFRRLTSPNTLRDLNPMMHDRMLTVCFFLKMTTPFGKRIVELITTYVLGKKLTVTAKDERVQAVLDKFWTDPVNKMDATVRDWEDEKTWAGELCVPLVRNSVDGTVRVGYLDPMNIDTIQYGAMKTTGGHIAISLPYAVRPRQEVGGPQLPPMRLVYKDEDPNSETFGSLQGECFYFAINKSKSASRGISELFCLADWIDVFDQMIFDYADRTRLLNQFVWQYTLEGADEPRVNDYTKKVTKNPPKQGGVLVTNEKVKLEAKTPDFKGQDMSAGAATVRNYGLAGAGFPAYFFADGENSNKSTAVEQGGPTGKKLEDRQNHTEECLTQVLDFVIDSAVQAGTLPEGVDRSYSIDFPAIGVRDLVNGATTLTGATQALEAAQDRGWIRPETAARAFMVVLSEIGTEIDDPTAEFDQAQEELQEQKREDQNQLNDQSQLAQAMQQMQAGRTMPQNVPAQNQPAAAQSAAAV